MVVNLKDVNMKNGASQTNVMLRLKKLTCWLHFSLVKTLILS